MAGEQSAHRNLRLHVTIVIVVPGFLALGWWQLHRALSGNELSWAYVFEWPLFAGYAVYMWWKLIHDESPVPKRRAVSQAAQAKEAAKATAEDEELAAYNEYLAALNVSDKAKGS